MLSEMGVSPTLALLLSGTGPKVEVGSAAGTGHTAPRSKVAGSAGVDRAGSTLCTSQNPQ